MLSKIKSIKLSNYFEIIKPKYVYLQIKPHKSTRNYNSTNIAKAILYTYKSINKRIRIEQKKLFVETTFKISYVIDIEKSNSSFYFIVPEVFLNIIIEKIREIWPKVELNITDPIKRFSNETIYYQLNYKKEDALSLTVDKKSNEPLNGILSVMEIMQEEDRVTIIYNFIPKSQYNWVKRYNDTMSKIKDLKPIEKDKTSAEYMLKSALSFMNLIFTSLVEVANDFSGGKKKTNELLSELLITSDVLDVNKRLTNETKLKKEKNVLDTQILICSNSKDKTRQYNNALSVSQAYRTIDGDNELVYKEVRSNIPIDIEKYKFKNIGENTFSVDECQNFIQQPGRLLMRMLGIQHIEVNEVKVPKELQKGYIKLGTVKCKGELQEAYIEDTYDKGSLPLVLVGAQGAGKSTFMANYYRFANIRKEGGVVIDFIKNCEMSNEIISYLPEEDLIILDYTIENDIQGFAFNEFKLDHKMNIFEKLSLTNLQAQQVLTFVDAINQDQPLQARMRKYLSAAANVVFATQETSLKEVIKCLENHEDRRIYINKLSNKEKEYLEEEIKSLNELDEYSKVTKTNLESNVVGTKLDRIDGIIDRISLLREDFKLKYMFNKGSKGNINFAEELEKGKTILIRMPQDSYKKHSKNVIVTFLLSKIWISTELRGKINSKPKKTHIAIDEPFQTKTAMRMLANDEILPQTRKFGCKFIFSCQYTEQIDILMNTLVGAGASFMLLNGTSEKDFKTFENKLDGFEFEDLRDMERFSSLNLLYYSKGYASFISKLPKPI
ncbi:hypothetical protein [Clostridium sp. YIM B02551]|uniref:hypothetical protein n=1 Tax=Clostridium sp. YIM B02551 TaxID=2910679 RepID=UPI001EEC1494|nr:hypothetical protein [Clostridium sp. YIM B02551]